jgi:hypothetical protein
VHFFEDESEDSPDDADGDDDNNTRAGSTRSKSKGKKPASKAADMETWYLVCESKKDKEECVNYFVFFILILVGSLDTQWKTV